MSARGLVSIDARVEMSIVVLSRVSIDEVELVSIDAVCFSLRINPSKRAGFENKISFSLLFCVLQGMHLEKKNFFVSNLKQKLKPRLILLIKSNGESNVSQQRRQI